MHNRRARAARVAGTADGCSYDEVEPPRDGPLGRETIGFDCGDSETEQNRTVDAFLGGDNEHGRY